MVTKENLKKYAELLMFDMKDSEYETLLKEFDVILKQMDLIGEIKDIEKVDPMTFPYRIYHAEMRKDEVKQTIDPSRLLSNAKKVENNEVRVPKVVE